MSKLSDPPDDGGLFSSWPDWAVYAAFITVALICIGLLVAQPTPPYTIGVSWDAVDHPDLARYEVAVGHETGNYHITWDAPMDTTVYALDLPECREYYINIRSCESLTGGCGEWDGEVRGYPLVEGKHCVAMPRVTGLRRNDAAGGM